MADDRTILDLFGVDLTFLTEVVKANPSLRGIIIGYLAERKLWEFFWPTDPAKRRVTAIRKDDDHDRDSKGDLVVTYQGFEFRIEVKSLQTNSVKMLNPATGTWMPKVIKKPQPLVPGQKRRKNKWEQCELFRTEWLKATPGTAFKGGVQCDASDNREIELPNGARVKTTNLKVGEFDLLALGLFAFREKWDFGFMLNRDLPRTDNYTPDINQHLLKTMIPVEWPLPPTVADDPFTLLDVLVQERRSTTPSPGSL